jgi:hypothetical protein
MNMNTAFRTSIAASVLAIAMAGCASTSGGLSSSAERLERASYTFERNSNEGGSYERDARDLAAEARDFNRTLKDRQADDRDVREAFQDLSRSYHAARDEVERERDREADRDFAAVTEAYLDVERAMNSSETRDRYASGDRDRRDR